MRKIDYHADDYGISMSASRHIIELIKAGKLDSISIMPNMPAFDESMALLLNEWDGLNNKPMISIHLNVVGGHSLTEDRLLDYSWRYLFFHSFFKGSKYKTLKESIKKEFVAQINKCTDYQMISKIRLDSHQHTHMIPVVFDAMMDAVLELGIKDRLEFVRITREPLSLFLFSVKGFGSFPLINVIKNVLLNILSIRVVRKLRPYGISDAMVWGMLRSGLMTEDHHRIFSEKVCKFANKKNRYVELVAHPGYGSDSSELWECFSSDIEFTLSKNRQYEYEMLLNR